MLISEFFPCVVVDLGRRAFVRGEPSWWDASRIREGHSSYSKHADQRADQRADQEAVELEYGG